MRYQRFLGGVSNTCRDSEVLAQILNRRWLLSRPDTRIQPVLVSCRPADDNLQSLRFSSCREPTQENNGVLYIIRDDLLHPVMGGNKLRKLDALLPLLHSASVTDVITCGGCQSAHAAALAVACAESGLRAHLLLRGEKLSIPTGYNLISGMYGEVTYVPRSHYADRETMLAKYAKTIAENGPVVCVEGMQFGFDAAFNSNLFERALSSSQPSRKVAIVKEGASDATALLGLIRLVDYLAQPCCFGRDQNLQLVVDSGTGTTAVGLAIGIWIMRLPWEVVGVMLVGTAESFRDLCKRLLDDFNKMWALDGKSGIPQEGLDSCINWVERQRPRKFGNVLEGEIQACRKIAKETGILLDPIYTLAAWEVGSKLNLSNDKKVVVLHTGGTMGLFGLAQRYATEF